MQCNHCEEKAVYHELGRAYCKNHFLSYFEEKVEKTIKKYKLIEKNDHVCVATSGGKDSLAVLYTTMKYCRKHEIPFFALAIDEGIALYRDHTLEDLKKFCDQHDIPLQSVSFKEKFGKTLDEVQNHAITVLNKKPCTVCGIFRRTLLNRTAREIKATKLVTGHNLDDEAQTLLMNLLKGNMRHNAALGPLTGLSENEGFVPRVKPLYHISERETRLYCVLRGFEVNFHECPNIHLSFRAGVRDMLNELENKSPGAKHGMINAFLEILPDLKKKYREEKKFKYCKKCNDPCAGETCNACKQEEELCKEAK
ncbi:TIGR00269 family protein [Candidatus Woesearchaeota archaeon]|nr:TIGR00269 family protein [Candidatus Woesearchaeota archaeon]